MKLEGSLPLSRAPVTCLLSQISPVHAKHPTSWTSVFIITSHIRLGFPSGLFHSGSPTIILYLPPFSRIHTTCPAHLILLNLITRIIFDDQYRSQGSSASRLLHSRVISFHLGPNIFLSTLFSNTLDLIPPSMWETKFDTHTHARTHTHTHAQRKNRHNCNSVYF
jgi:hypothetical protein